MSKCPENAGLITRVFIAYNKRIEDTQSRSRHNDSPPRDQFERRFAQLPGETSVNKILATVAGLAIAVLPATAMATTTTGSVGVSALVNKACTLSNATLTFPAYDPS